MQASPICIPTDSMGDLRNLKLTQEAYTTLPDYLNNSMDGSTLEDSEKEPAKPRNKLQHRSVTSVPQEKLSQALTMAEKFIQEKELLKANKELIRCVALTRIIHGDGHWKLAQSFANLAHGYLTLQGLPVQAKAHAEAAKDILLNTVQATKSEEEKKEILGTLVTIYYTIGMAHLMQGTGRESYLNLQKVEQILREMQGLNRNEIPELKTSENDITIALGRACLLQNKLTLAVEYFENAINYITSMEGDTVPELINLYQDIAKAEQLRKMPERAIEHLLQAHSISVALYKKDSVEAARTGILLARAHAASEILQYIQAAEIYFVESLNAYRMTLGPDDIHTLSTVVEFSKWLIQVGNKQEAYDLLNDCFKCEEDTDLDLSEKMAEIQNLMGSICLAEGKLQKACKLLKKCLEIQNVVYGSQHKKTKETLELLNMLQRSRGGGGES
ncbi:tetratricopeptide repeat protein 23-like [Microcaecilia unicolor]|uniref:Tetratricopeptide repeat protein 23-like n=1 Tax=Microcaecilia unicolor TaxID=1415580 RepID=A0A6P7XE35_9AMPH|nr:tetratricopeptide repeat protein 23-like [Microcaecilia unicolor]